uniref:CAZy families GH36 protein n=1 Tax=uncultured Burkholderia sp. TaxID=188058 RepID=A0A060C6T1_9BURK|nr:CAZy families GH36 protein [uncultured Burkholderia sp.]
MWLKYGDNIWRGGGDMGTTGAGNRRQQWMNFRDAVTYQNIVSRAPLYPLNALMNHGLTVGTKGQPSKLENDFANLSDDFWTFFSNGTSLQEMYINPHLLTSREWDELAKAIRWARAKQDVLVDVQLGRR